MFGSTSSKLRSTVIPAAAVLVAVAASATLGAGPAAAAGTDTMATATQGTTGMTMHIANDSNETMTLTSASNPYGHW